MVHELSLGPVAGKFLAERHANSAPCQSCLLRTTLCHRLNPLNDLLGLSGGLLQTEETHGESDRKHDTKQATGDVTTSSGTLLRSS